MRGLINDDTEVEEEVDNDPAWSSSCSVGFIASQSLVNLFFRVSPCRVINLRFLPTRGSCPIGFGILVAMGFD